MGRPAEYPEEFRREAVEGTLALSWIGQRGNEYAPLSSVRSCRPWGRGARRLVARAGVRQPLRRSARHWELGFDGGGTAVGSDEAHVEWERGVGEVGGEQRHADTSRFEEAGDALGEPDDGGFRGDVWGAVRGFGAAGSVR